MTKRRRMFDIEIPEGESAEAPVLETKSAVPPRRAPQKKEVAAAKVETQKKVDAAIAGKLDATMKGYLGSRFSLKSGQYPHEMVF